MKRVELLAPAGSMECFETALLYGADAVYLAGKRFGLRAFADNFSEEELSFVVKKAHSLGKKVYVTVNSLFHNRELEGLDDYLSFLKGIDVDAVIVSDPGVMVKCLEHGLELHVSTQVSTMNYGSVMFWHNMGAKRIVLGRETSLAEIAEMRKKLPDSVEIESFVHGAMCIAYSGRCLLSAVLTGRSGNRGACAQACRWKFALSEKDHEGQYFPIEEENHETFILNSKDMMMIEHVPELIEAGISSFKVEGRMKSMYYVASVIHAYREAIDRYYEDREGYVLDESLVKDLKDCATRGFTTGFYFDNGDNAGDQERTKVERDYIFCGLVKEVRDSEGYITVEQRNKFVKGDRINILSPDRNNYNREFVMEGFLDTEGNERDQAPHPQEILRIRCPYDLRPGDILRTVLEQ